MHDPNSIFTINLIVDGDNSKLLLSTSDVPAKEDDEASGVIYKSELPEQFEEIVSKIPIFKTAMEDEGSEESVTHTFDEFSNLYDLDLVDLIERGEEILHTDLDDDNEEGEGEEHKEQVLGSSEEHEESEPMGYEEYEEYDSPSSIYAREEDAMSHIDPREALGNY